MSVNISLCMIVKNEATRLDRCLSSAAPYGFEIIIVDTGSTDSTKEIALKYTDKVFDFKWSDDFSAARNYSLEQASNDWIFMLDSDEWIESIDIEEMQYFKKKYPDALGAVNRNNKNGTPEHPSYSIDRTERLFNRKKYKYSGTIHEMLVPKYNFELDCLLLNTTIGHDGYCMTEEERQNKAHRNISMLLTMYEQNPDDPYTLYQLGKGYDIISDYENSIKYYSLALDFDLDYSLAYVQSLFTCCIDDYLRLNHVEQALKLLEEAPEITDSADYYYVAGKVLYHSGQLTKALMSLNKAMTFDFANRQGANSYLAKQLIEIIQKETNKAILPISICIIAKNEEKNIDQFLNSIENALSGYEFDIVFVDTGSSDNTLDIVEKHNIKPYHFTWVNDFSAARNYSLSLAQNDFVLVLDCDEFITEINVEELIAFTIHYPNSIGLLSRNNHFILNETDTIYTDNVERLFNRKIFNYSGSIHEQVVPVVQKENMQAIQIPLVVNHNGYNLSREELEKKANRNNELLFKQLEEDPDNPYIYFQIGQSYNLIHDDEKANYYYGKGLELDVNPELEYVQMMVIEYGYTLLHLNRASEALSYEGIYDAFSHIADFLVLMGLIYMNNERYIDAMQEFLKAITTEECHTVGSNSYIPRYNIGLINEMMGRKEDAIALYQSCGEFPMAQKKLKELS